MLDCKDLIAIRDIMKEETDKLRFELRAEIKASNEELRAEIKASNEELRAEIKASNEELRTEIKISNMELRTEFDHKLKNTKDELIQTIKSERKESEVFLLDEMERMRHHFDQTIGEVKNKVDEIEQFYRIRHLEMETNSTLIQRLTFLEKRVKKIEGILNVA